MAMNDDHIARLESEIRYLKGLLDENGIPYDYEAFVEAARREEPVEIELPVLTAEYAIQFYSYFRGRKDVYVKRNAKKGYFTQCNNFWKTGVCGGFTTFSTFSLEAFSLFEKKAYLSGSIYIVLSVAFCILGVLLGKRIAVLLHL
jgi:hypothetical protein